MGIFRRLLGGETKADQVDAPPTTPKPSGGDLDPSSPVEAHAKADSEPSVDLPAEWPHVSTLTLGRAVEPVGATHYQTAMGDLLGDDYKLDRIALLVPEPANPFDKNAVGVYVDGVKVGHLSRQEAVSLRPEIDEAIERSGVAASTVSVYRGYEHWTCLEPTSADPVSRPALIQALVDAGYEIGASFRTGFDVKIEEDRLVVIWNKVAKDKQAEVISEIAKALRDRGYSARVVSVVSRPFVSVTGYQP
jgi:hypothetical protein